MTTQDKIKVLAEADGWEFHPSRAGIMEKDGQVIYELGAFGSLLNSYDAILPLIQKQSVQVKTMIVNILDLSSSGTGFWFDHTPEQLADAFIKAIGKWKE